MLGHTVANDFIDTTFHGRTQSSFSSVERTIHVSLYFSLDGQMNMLQVSSYTGHNPQTTNQERK